MNYIRISIVQPPKEWYKDVWFNQPVCTEVATITVRIFGSEQSDFSYWRGPRIGDYRNTILGMLVIDNPPCRELVCKTKEWWKEWYKGVRFNHSTPKYSYDLTWLAIHNRLSTGDIECGTGQRVNEHIAYFVAREKSLARNHLFFHCHVTQPRFRAISCVNFLPTFFLSSGIS